MVLKIVPTPFHELIFGCVVPNIIMFVKVFMKIDELCDGHAHMNRPEAEKSKLRCRGNT
jgi:hypothetical protein